MATRATARRAGNAQLHASDVTTSDGVKLCVEVRGKVRPVVMAQGAVARRRARLSA